MAKAKPAATVNDELRGEIAELLLDGMAPARIAARLASRGIPGGIAEAELARAEKAPAMAAAQRLRERLEARIAKRDWWLANQARLAAIDGAEVPRLDRLPAPRFFAEFYAANRPVLVTGLIDHWPARRWTFEGLAAALGSAEIEVQANRDTNADYELDKDAHARVERFGHIVERILTGGPSNDFYVTAYNSRRNKAALAPLWADVGDIPGWLVPTEARDGFFWMGPQGTITPFHHDLTNNLLVGIAGEKRVKLVAPGDSPRMRNHRHCFSQWRGEELPAGPGDSERPPVREVLLGPGDALFLPVGWWHHVEALTPTIGMSFINFAADNDFYSHYNSYSAL